MKDNQPITALIVAQVEKLAHQFGYDFLSEKQGNQTLCQILQRATTRMDRLNSKLDLQNAHAW